MQYTCTNIYKTARQTAGYTQERWAEVLGISVESVRLYESTRGLPSDEVVARMAEVAVMPVLCYWHLKHKSAVANDILPDVDRLGLPQAVLQLLAAIQGFSPRCNELIAIAADGRIDAEEMTVYSKIVDELNDIIKAALTVIYAEGGAGNERGTGHEQP